VTIFSDSQLAKLVSDTIPMSSLPAGHTNAIVGTVDATGAQVVVGVTKDLASATWQVQGAYRQEWSGNKSAAAKVIVSW
jgi:hypothetical protein